MKQLTDYFSLKGKVAVVTGAVNDIAFQIADALSAVDARIAIVDTSEQEGIAAADRLGCQHDKARFWQADVSDDNAVRQAITSIEAHFSRIDILINCAGVNVAQSPAQGLSIAQWQRAMQLNVNGCILCSKHVADAMDRAGGGAIVNVLSPCGMTGSREASADFAAKAALRMAYIDAQRYAARNIRVNCIHPCLIRPPVLEAAMREEGDLTQTFIDMQQIRLPGPKGSNNDVAAGVLYLVSDAGRFVTSSELVINSGHSFK
ncbi:SDR family NAD(P)-dependent oxidoreductase [Collimonas sp. H4R21]|uniref:SDR family NAD(P)-dependent oxidoreductase n=1 Tax=Collimonas rhizosphaerae TaxID=3126357 RepID=A0ABU9PWH2_9BURK